MREAQAGTRGDSATERGGLHRAARSGGLQAHGQAAPGRHPKAIRLPNDRWDSGIQPSKFRAWAKVRGEARQDPVLSAEEARKLLDSIETTTLMGLPDRALIGVMVYSFARVGW